MWRHSDYGAWVPNTARIKLASLDPRVERGWNYVVSAALSALLMALGAALPARTQQQRSEEPHTDSHLRLAPS